MLIVSCLGMAGMAVAAPLQVVTTTGMVADLARNVGGPRVQVISIMQEGVDPHLYKPVASDVRRIMKADVVFYNGLKLEGRMGDIFERAAKRGTSVWPIGAMVDPSALRTPEAHPDHPDPHIWMDVSLWQQAVAGVAAALCKEDPDGCHAYQENAARYQQQLAQLDTFIRSVISTIPDTQRVLITAHDAFGYFGQAYGIEVRGIQGMSTESEAGLADVRNRVDQLVTQQIPAVFVETSVHDKYVRALVEGAQARGHIVQVGGELYSASKGQPGSPTGTYIGMMDHNARTIASALGGHVPTERIRGDASSN